MQLPKGLRLRQMRLRSSSYLEWQGIGRWVACFVETASDRSDGHWVICTVDIFAAGTSRRLMASSWA